MGNNKNKIMCTRNDKGLFCCLPSFISLFLLAIFDILVITSSILSIDTFDGAQTYQGFLYINIALGVWQIIPFILHLIWREAAWARFTIFFSQLVIFLWMSIFFILCIVYLAPGLCSNRPSDSCTITHVLVFFVSFILTV